MACRSRRDSRRPRIGEQRPCGQRKPEADGGDAQRQREPRRRIDQRPTDQHRAECQQGRVEDAGPLIGRRAGELLDQAIEPRRVATSVRIEVGQRPRQPRDDHHLPATPPGARTGV